MSTTATKVSTTDNAPTKEQKPTAALEEDDEFEDFPAEGMGIYIKEAIHACGTVSEQD